MDDLQLEDGSGNLELEDASGNLELEAGAGAAIEAPIVMFLAM